LAAQKEKPADESAGFGISGGDGQKMEPAHHTPTNQSLTHHLAPACSLACVKVRSKGFALAIMFGG
jgi:hypothetical protein